MTSADPGPTGSPSFFVTLASQRRRCDADRLRRCRNVGRSAIGLRACHHGPQRPRRFVSDRGRRHIHRPATDEGSKPGPWCHTLAERSADHSPCAVNQQCAQISITSLADPPDVFPSAASRAEYRRRGVFSMSARRFIISSVIGRPSGHGLCCNQTLPKSADDHRATHLHHVPGHDLSDRTAPVAERTSAFSAGQSMNP